MAVILVIDDSAAIRRMIGHILIADKHDVIEAEDGEIGFRLAKAHRPALVITDIFMPNREGIETIRGIRNLGGNIKIIAISGGSKTDERLYLDAATVLGADGTLKKPFRPTELRDLVRNLLGLSIAPP